MSLHLCLSKQGYLLKKDQIDEQTADKIKKDLTVKPLVLPAYKDFVKVKPFEIFQESPNYFFLPRYYGVEQFGSPKRNQLPEGQPINVKTLYDLLPHQVIPFKKALTQLQQFGGGVLSLPCGCGKTKIAIDLIAELGGKGLVVVNKECLMDQWIDSISKFTHGKAKVGIIQQNKIEVEGKDYVIAMLHSLSQKEYDKKVFEDFRMTVVDECHHIGSEMFSKALPKIASKYTLGLSATPKRKDGLSHVFYKYLGPLFHSEKRQGSNRVLVKRFKLTSTSPSYKVLYMSNGVKNTSAMITQLSQYEIRTQLIVECIRILMKQDRKILLLSARRQHLEDLCALLKKSEIKTIRGIGITFGFYWGNQGLNKKEHKKMLAETAKCDVILGTDAIASEGLDIPDLNTELLTTPSADVEQKVGRILRKYHTNLNPLVVDLVDMFANFHNQSKSRCDFYLDEDYEVQDLSLNVDKDFPTKLGEIEKYLLDTNFKDQKYTMTKDELKEETDEGGVVLGRCLLDENDTIRPLNQKRNKVSSNSDVCRHKGKPEQCLL